MKLCGDFHVAFCELRSDLKRANSHRNCIPSWLPAAVNISICDPKDTREEASSEVLWRSSFLNMIQSDVTNSGNRKYWLPVVKAKLSGWGWIVLSTYLFGNTVGRRCATGGSRRRWQHRSGSQCTPVRTTRAEDAIRHLFATGKDVAMLQSIKEGGAY